MVFWFVRALYILLIAAMCLLSLRDVTGYDQETSSQYQNLLYSMSLSAVMLGLSIDLLVKRKSLTSIAGLFFGLLVGLLVGVGFNKILESVYEAYSIPDGTALFMVKTPIKWFINIMCCYLAIIFIMQTKDDFRFIIPYVEFSKQTKGGCPFILDTSVIIDGRIADIATTRIMNAPLIIPRFILNELQNIADSSDRMRRTRGRRGLDILNKMQSDPALDITVEDIALTATEQNEPVDHKLVAACLKLGGKVVTNDYNLNKVASIRGVDVININDLANALKPILLPGETLRVKMIKPGDQAGQGVGYLDDGTMVVVDDARNSLGQEIEAVVTSVLQTSAGRMIFGRLDSETNGGGGGGPRSNNHNQGSERSHHYRTS